MQFAIHCFSFGFLLVSMSSPSHLASSYPSSLSLLISPYFPSSLLLFFSHPHKHSCSLIASLLFLSYSSQTLFSSLTLTFSLMSLLFSATTFSYSLSHTQVLTLPCSSSLPVLLTLFFSLKLILSSSTPLGLANTHETAPLHFSFSSITCSLFCSLMPSHVFSSSSPLSAHRPLSLLLYHSRFFPPPISFPCSPFFQSRLPSSVTPFFLFSLGFPLDCRTHSPVFLLQLRLRLMLCSLHPPLAISLALLNLCCSMDDLPDVASTTNS